MFLAAIIFFLSVQIDDVRFACLVLHLCCPFRVKRRLCRKGVGPDEKHSVLMKSAFHGQLVARFKIRLAPCYTHPAFGFFIARAIEYRFVFVIDKFVLSISFNKLNEMEMLIEILFFGSVVIFTSLSVILSVVYRPQIFACFCVFVVLFIC